jgi:hypothetical protein
MKGRSVASAAVESALESCSELVEGADGRRYRCIFVLVRPTSLSHLPDKAEIADGCMKHLFIRDYLPLTAVSRLWP